MITFVAGYPYALPRRVPGRELARRADHDRLGGPRGYAVRFIPARYYGRLRWYG